MTDVTDDTSNPETDPVLEAEGQEERSADGEATDVPVDEAPLAEASPEADEQAPAQPGGYETSPRPELLRLVDLAAKYPEIGPPLAQLAFKIGQPDFGNQIVRMGLDKEGPGLEYYFVVAHSARRERRYAEARQLSVDAIHAFVRTPDEELALDDGERLLHLVRLGYSTLLFDEKDPKGDPAFVDRLKEALPALEPRLASEAFYHALLAQTRWYEDAEASERSWDRAAELDTSESTWNARGTWYKDAEGDLDKAEQAYRKGLQVASSSPLLLHNLGQLLVDKAERPDVDVDKARRLLNEAEQCLRAALREESPKGLRRHVHSTRDRLMSLRSSLPPRGVRREEAPVEPEREPAVGEVLQGRVRSIAAFGVFVALPGCGTGLLHKSEIAHEAVDDPGQLLQVGQEIEVKVLDVGRRDGKLRIGLSRKVLLPKPEGMASPAPHRPRQENKPAGQDQGRRREDPRDRQGGPRRGGQDDRGNRPRGPKTRDDDKLASLGEMLLAKINQQKKP